MTSPLAPIAAAVLLALIAGTAHAQGAELRIVQMSGSVQIDGRPASAGGAFASGRIATGTDGSVQVRTPSGSMIVLPASSEVQLAADAPATLRLAKGGVRLASAGTEWRVLLDGRSVRTNGYLKLQECAAGCTAPNGLYGRIAQGEAVLEYQGGRQVLRNRSFRWASASTRPESLAVQPAILNDADSQAAAVRVRTDVAATLKAGIEAFGTGDDAAAARALQTVAAAAPGETLVTYYLGLIALRREDSAEALRLLQQYAREDPDGAAQRDVTKTLTLLSSAQLQQEVAQAVAREQEVTASPPEPGSIAVQAFVNRGSEAYRAMAKGLAAMVIADLSKVPALKVLEREKVQLLVNEAKLGDSGLADTRSAVRSGRLMRAEKVVVGNFEVPAQAQPTFSLEGAVIDSRSSANLGVISERGAIDALFKAQKAMTFGILRSAGISLDQLPSDIRARVERFQTTNVEAFRAYSQGLDLKDQGKYAEAREFFRRAAELDPNFALASQERQAMPDVNLGTAITTRAVISAAAGAAVDRGKATYAIDAGRAAAALAAGQTVVLVPLAQLNDTAQALTNGFTSNPAGSGTNLAPNLVAGVAYSYASQAGPVVTLANVNEYRADRFRTTGAALDSVGTASDFEAQRGGAATSGAGSVVLADGTTAYWGRWNSAVGASATVRAGGVPITAPVLGPVDYVFAEATRTMPTSGTAVFAPTGGQLQNTSGSIAVNFVNRQVNVQNVGFTAGGFSFSGLNGTATYSDRIASGAFSGNYSSGACSNCPAFTPQSSQFGGNFIGSGASGLVFSTILLTGNNGIASGVQLFTRGGPP
jgi:tetratricopeptide (TPR) repeat protein